MANKVGATITANMIEAVERRREADPNMIAPWKRTWNGTEGVQRNMATGHAYRGGNVFMTMVQGYASPLWLTRKQLTKIGGAIKRTAEDKQERYTPIYFWKFASAEEKAAGKNYAYVRFYQVWNTDQIDGIADRVAKILTPDPNKPVVNPIAAAEDLWAKWLGKPEVTHGGNRACYSPSMDRINIARMADFDGAEDYYRTLFHEGGHGTGHDKRLGRPGVVNPIRFASHEYSEEELIAEMTAAMLASACGIASPEADANSAAYLDHWLAKLSKNPEWLIHAGGQAQKAADMVMGITWEK